MSKDIWIVMWWPAEYEEGIIMGGFYSKESAELYIAEQHHPTQYGTIKSVMEERDGR